MNKTTMPHTALINSSYSIFFVGASVLWANILSGYFPNNYQTKAFWLFVVFSLSIFVVRFFLIQFNDANKVLHLLLFYFSLSALMAVLSEIVGPVEAGEVPAIQASFVGSYLSVSNIPSFFYPTIFTFYGAVTLVFAQLSASLFEFVYTKTSLLLPKSLRRILKKIDSKIDRNSINASDDMFFLHDTKGFIAVGTLLVSYVVLYIVLLVV